MPMPAARMTDMHTCPMVVPPPTPHVGGPIAPPGVPVVLIGMLPSAPAPGNTSICCGPPDVIVKGSCTVLVQNRMAARCGDQTSHGGVILPPGQPTVLIGG